MMKEQLGNSYLFGANAPFIEALYDAWLRDPAAVDARWRDYFEELQRVEGGAADVSHFEVQDRFARLAREHRTGGATVLITRQQLGEKQFGVLQLISAHRFLGVRHADIDPRRRQEEPKIPELDPAFYGLTEADLETVFNTGTLFGPREMKLGDILKFLKDTYCRTIGVEYMYITDMAQKRWVQERLETVRSAPAYDADYKKHILERLTAAETLEKYLHTRYVGQKRFSLEGGESLIPLL